MYCILEAGIKLITLKTFDDVTEAYVLKSRLEHEGITCYLHDENTVSVNPLFSQLVGGVKLKIEEKDLGIAASIVQDINENLSTDDSDNVITCPKCNSSNLIAGFKSVKSVKGIFSAIISFLLFVYPFHYNSVFKCKECNLEFKPER